MRSAFTGFIAALAVVASSVLVAISFASLLQQAASPGLDRLAVVAFVVVAALLLPVPIDDGWRVGAWVGVALGVVGAIAADSLGAEFSFGAGQLGAILGGIVAVPVLHVIWDGETTDYTRWSRRLAGFVLVLVAIGLLRTIIEGGALGHDESAYALKARAWVMGTPDTGWQLHRAPLNSLLGVPVVAFTENEVPFRTISALLGLGALAGVGLVANRLGGMWSAVLAMAAVGASLPFLRRSSEYLTDVPAAGLLLVIVWLVLTIVAQPEAWRGRVWWLAPLVLAAFYMRYQSALAVLGIALGVVIVWPKVISLLRKELLIAAGATAVGLLPHLIWATAATGVPWGVITVTQGAAGRDFIGEGLVDYVRFFPKDLVGPAGALLMVAGLVWLLWKTGASLAGQGRNRETDIAWFLVTVLVAAIGPLGLVAHGEPRFVFFPVWLLVGVGSALVIWLIQRLPSRIKLIAWAMAMILWLPLFTETVGRSDRNAEARGETFAVVADGSNAVESDSGSDCGVLTTYQPQVTWYSNCWTELFRPNDDDLGVGRLEGEYQYALLFENGKRQPQGETLDEYLSLGPNQIVPASNDRIGDATIVRIN